MATGGAAASVRLKSSACLHFVTSRWPGSMPHLRRCPRNCVTENGRVLQTVDLLRADKYGDIGPLLSASHASLRDDYRVSCDELDVAVEAAESAGALGARMVGGGFGGSAIALVQADGRAEVEAAVTAAYAARSFTAPRMFTAVPSAGAGQDR
jgi:galactokinase